MPPLPPPRRTGALQRAGLIALFAGAILAASDPAIADRLAGFRKQQTEAARAMRVPPAG